MSQSHSSEQRVTPATVQCIVREGGIKIAVRIVSRGGRNAVDCMTDTGALRIQLAAPPVDGAANAALVAFLAASFDVPKRAVTITYGHRGRDTRVLIATPLSVVTAKICAAYEHA